MMYYLIAIILSFLAVFGAFVALRVKITNDKLYAIGAKKFYDSVDSILQTPRELPDGMLVLLADMNSTLTAKGSAFAFHKVLKKANKKGTTARRSPSFDVKKLRPEIDNLLAEAFTGWLTAMRYKSVLAGGAIEFELRKSRVARGDLTDLPDRSAPIDLYNSLHPEAAAA